MQKLLPTLICILALSCSIPSSAKEKLAVMDLKAKHGVEKSLAAALSDIVRDRIHSHGDYEVLSKGDIEAIAERTEIVQKLGCDDTQCLINIGQELETRFMVAGAISKMGGIYTLHLRMLETMGTDPGVRKRANKDCPCSEDDLIQAARAIADRLLGKAEVAMAPQTRETKHRRRLGIKISTVTPRLAKRLGMETAKGVMLNAVEQGSPAAEAGLRPGDAILEIDRQAVNTAESFAKSIAETHSEVIMLLVWRRGYSFFCTLRLGE